jgi:AraC-like DNA-binding protein
MRFSYIAPSPTLRAFIRNYLIAHFRFDSEKPAPLKPYAPKPEQGITFFVRGRPTMVNPLAGEVHRAPAVSIFRQQVLRCDVHLPADFLMFRVHFEPGALFRLLNVPLNELDETYFDAELVLSSAVREVAERLAAARGFTEMVEVVEAFLSGRVERVRRDVHRVDRVVSCLAADPLNASLDKLARQACVSPRQLHRTFMERLGVGPKLYSRLVRFHRASLFKASHPSIAWPTIAVEFGYTDYQHMVRDFKQFANATPNLWLQEDATSPENALTRSGTE